jgi:hypothetical protein
LSDVNANIGINFDTQQALASLRQLQAGLSRFNQSLTQGNIAAENAQKGLNAQLMQSINATGKFVASQKVVAGSTSAFTTALEKNQLSMGEYFRFTAAAATANTKVFSKMFAHERDIFNRARKDRVKSLQTQYIQLTNANGELVKVLQVVPKHLKMVNGQYADYATRTQMAAQRQQMMNQLLKQGSTQLLNFGKNTQWAGRQLMVGLTVPLTMLGSVAAKTFKEMEMAVISFTRVYGSMFTTGDSTEKAIADIQRLAKEFTKYGIAAKDTVEMAAKAAAMGLTGSALNQQVIAATKLAVLGQVEQQQALETTISLQNAFGISAQDLAQKINFLNAVENQTVLSIEDLTIAIPKAGPVVKQLGGSVEDLAFFMTAMKEGGINASEGANALKSGLASMINPAKKTSEFLAGLGINIKGIVDNNAGNLKMTVIGFAQALDKLDPLNRARAIEQMFGKFQFARLSTLFQNVTKDSSQAARALGLAGATVEELAILSERELGKVEDAVGVKFQKTIEQLKLELIPIGKTFLQALTPVVEFLGKILAKFNNFGEGTKKAIAITIGVVGGLAPVVLMTFGLLMNALANGVKLFASLRNGMAKLNGQNQVLGGGFDYLTQQEIEQLAQTNALHTSHQNLISTFNVEAGSVNALAAAYANAASQARTLAASSPGLFNTVPGPAGAVSGLPKKFAKGGVVPGSGNKDTVPSMLTPGEVVLTKDTVKDNPELVAGLLTGKVKRYSQSTQIEGGGMEVPSDISSFAAELGAMAKRPKDIAAVTENIQIELMKAFTRGMQKGGPEMATTLVETIKGALRTAADRIGSTNKTFAETTTKETNPDTGESWREPYGKKSATKWQGGDYVAAHLAPPKPKITDPAELERLSGMAGDSDLGRALALAAEHGGSATPMGSFTAMLPEAANQTTDLDLSNPDDAAIHSQLAARRGKTPAQFTGKEAKVFEMPTSGIQELFTGADAGKSLAPVMREIARQHGLSFEQAVQDPAILAEMTAATDKLGGFISEELALLPDKIGEQDLYEAVDRASGRLTEADGKLKTAVDNLGKTTTYSVTTNEPAPTVDDPDRRNRTANRKDVPQKATAFREELGLTDADVTTTTPKGKTKVIPFGSYQKKNKANLDTGELIDQARGSAPSTPADRGADGMLTDQTVSPVVEASPEAIAEAEAAGESIGAAAEKGLKEELEIESPSKKGKKAGKDIADGIVEGMQEGEAAVSAQSEQLGKAAVPTAAQTQGKVDKMDLDNKAFYDDINTPEMYDERQSLKSQDRQRRKRAKEAGIGGGPETPPVLGPSSLTVSSTGRTQAASDKLAVRTEEAATAQAQIVQQIRDESKSRVTIKGNTINIGQAREEADKAEQESANVRKKAAALEAEQAKARRNNSPTTITDEQVLEAKERANAAELEAAEKRMALAMAEAEGKDIKISEDDVKDIGKVQKIQEQGQEELISGTQEQGDGLRRIVDGTNDTADSTVLVADQTEQLAGATEEAVTTQLGNNQNLMTASQLAGATAGSLNDVALTTDQTASAQQQVLDSTEDIADRNKEIEEQKRKEVVRLKRMNAEAEADRIAQEAGIVPPGSQAANGKFVNPETAMGSVEAYEEASTYTRDKNGQILFDPETNQPTTLTKKQITQKKRGMRREKVGKYSGKASGALGTATMVAGMVGAPPAVTAGLGALATVAQFAPAIAGLGPVGIALGAVAGMAGGLYMLDKAAEKAAKAQTELANKTQMTAKGLQAIGQVTGKVGATEIMDKRRSEAKSDRYTTNYDRKGQQFGTTFLESDPGKAMADGFAENIKLVGEGPASQQFAANLALAVSDGVMTSVQASDVARQMAIKFGDTTLQPRIDAELNRLIGPYGEDLLKDPLQVRLNLIDDQSEISKMTTDALSSSVTGDNNSMNSKISSVLTNTPGGFITQAALSGSNFLSEKTKGYNLAEAFTTTKSEKVAAFGAASNVNNMGAAQSQLDAYNLEAEKKIKELEAQKALTTDKAKQKVIEDQILAAQTAQEEGAQKIRDKIAETLDDQLAMFKVASQRSAVEGAFFDSLKESVNLKYKGTAMEAFTEDMLNKSADLKSKELEVTVNTIVASGQVNPLIMTDLLDAFTGDEEALQGVLDIAVKTHGADKIALLINNLGGIKKPEVKKKLTVVLSKLPTKQLDGINHTLTQLQTMDQKDFDINVYLGEDAEIAKTKLLALQKQLEGIESVPDPLTKAIQLENKGLDEQAMKGITANWEYFMSLPETVRKTAIQTYVSAYTTVTEDAVNTAIAKKIGKARGQAAARLKTYYASAEGRQAVIDELAMGATKPQYSATSPTPSGAGLDKGGGDKGKNQLDFLDNLAMRIKNVRDGAFDATKPLASMMAAFNAKGVQKDISTMFKMFDGLQQRMLRLSIPKEMRDMISGMSAEDFTAFSTLPDGKNMFTYDTYTSGPKKGKEKPRTKKNIKGVTEAGKAVFQTMREADLGDAQLVNAETIANVDEQKKAMNMLMAAGLSAADALATVQDQSVAAAIANKALGEVGSVEYEAYKASILGANDALERQAVLQDLVQKNADFQFAVKAQEFAGAFAKAGLSVDQINEVLQDPKLTNQLINDLKDGSIDAEHIKEYLNSIPQRLVVSLQTKLNMNDFSEAAKPGLEFIDQMFAIEEALIRAGAKDDASAANVKKIKDNEALIKAAEKELRLLQETKVVRESLANVVDASGKKIYAGVAMNYADLQEAIKTIQSDIEVKQRDLEMNSEYGTRYLDKLNEGINKMNRELETNKDWGSRAVQKLNEESALLSHDLDLINKAAEDVNKKYDEQAEALTKVQEINENILALQQDQLGLAGALTSGDISAAANAAQKMRATAAGQFASGQTDALENARKNSLDSLKSGSGMTSKQIEDRQYEISQKIYAMENNPARLKIQKDIVVEQDKIYKIEQDRKTKLEEIKVLEDSIYALNKELGKDDGLIDKINKKLTDYNTALTDAQTAIDDQVKNITVMGKDKEGWDLVKTKFDAYALALKSKDVKDALAALQSATTKVEGDWSKIHGWLDQFMKMPADKKVNVEVITTYTYNGKSDGNSEEFNLGPTPTSTSTPTATATPTPTSTQGPYATQGPTSSPTPTSTTKPTTSPTSTTKPTTSPTSTIKPTTSPTSTIKPTTSPTSTAPKVGETKYVGSMLMTWNGTQWMDQVAYNNAKVAPKVGETRYVGSDLMTWNGSQWVTQVAYNAKVVADKKIEDANENNRKLVAALQAKAALIPKSRTKPGTGVYSGGMLIAPVTQYLQPGTGVVVNGVLKDPVYKFAGGLIGMKARGSDTVPAMLTPGEFIMSKYAVDNFGVNNLKAINSGSTNVGGDSVYNYSLTVNAKSNASPDDIARTVMAQIQQIDSQRIRGVRI